MALTRKKIKSNMSNLSLPTEINEPPAAFEDQCSMFFGRKSWGKTTLISQYPDSLVMLVEPGRRNLKILQIPKEGEEITWDLLVEYVGLFLESDYQRLMIDTADRFYGACLKHSCLELSNGEHDTPTKFAMDERPSAYIYAQKQYEDVLEGIKSAGKSWVLTSHDTKRVTKHPITGEKEERIEPTCSGSAWKIAQSMCDYVFHVEFVQRQRVVCVRDLDNISIASCGRDDVFLDPDGTPLSRFAIPNEVSKAYETLLAAYNNQLRDISYIPPAAPLKKKEPKLTTQSKINFRKNVAQSNGTGIKKRLPVKK